MPATEAQIEANRANSQHSTGPRTQEGKSTSCLNNFRHGFRSTFQVLPTENEEEFESLLFAMRMEHQPNTPTEHMLVDKMVEHFWLSRRAQLLQDLSMDTEEPERNQQKSFALFLRYQTTNDRGFSKCLSDLLKFRADRRKQEADLEKQKQREAAERRKEAEALRKQEAHEVRVRMANAKAAEKELDTSIRETIEARLPGHTQIPFRVVKNVLANALEGFNAELDPNPELAKSFKAA